MNTFSRFSIFGAVFIAAAALWIFAIVIRSPYVTQANVVRDQPVPFSHAHHVGELGIDCRYCHTSVEDSGFAGIPPTKTCMGCHSQIYADSPMLDPVRRSFQTDRPIPWTRVHDLPDFAYFDHSVHVAKGVACVTCHGQVDEMPLMWRESTLHMEWCLECHREPERFIRPREHVFDMKWKADGDPLDLGRLLVEEYGVDMRDNRLTNCTVCHR